MSISEHIQIKILVMNSILKLLITKTLISILTMALKNGKPNLMRYSFDNTLIKGATANTDNKGNLFVTVFANRSYSQDRNSIWG